MVTGSPWVGLLYTGSCGCCEQTCNLSPIIRESVTPKSFSILGALVKRRWHQPTAEQQAGAILEHRPLSRWQNMCSKEQTWDDDACVECVCARIRAQYAGWSFSRSVRCHPDALFSGIFDAPSQLGLSSARATPRTSLGLLSLTMHTDTCTKLNHRPLPPSVGGDRDHL